jgi:hypothetical protein
MASSDIETFFKELVDKIEKHIYVKKLTHIHDVRLIDYRLNPSDDTYDDFQPYYRFSFEADRDPRTEFTNNESSLVIVEDFDEKKFILRCYANIETPTEILRILDLY